MSAQASSFRKRWLVPIVTLGAASMLVFWGAYLLDHFAVAAPGGPGPWARYSNFDPESITDAVSALAGMLAAVFGILVTVVSILVQLSAARYAGVARMFLRDRINVGVLAFYVIACVCGIWLSVAVHRDYVPRATVLAMLLATSAGLLLMGPYFGYVFWFLEPVNIIARIRRGAVTTFEYGARAAEPAEAFRSQSAALAAMEELTDITNNSISGKDKIIASGAVDALKDFALDYLERKSQAVPHWFSIGSGIARNPDFVAMDPESLEDLEKRRLWVEWKVMRQYLGIYNEALASMRDINYLIAIDTRYIGEAAARSGDQELVGMTFRFMNSYLRATLNARDVRTAYNVLNQYRLLVESMIKLGCRGRALEGVRHMSYYGHVSYDMKLPFVTETIAYDISSLCQSAHEQESPDEEAMLRQFLELDRPLRTSSQESALLGVRKAQVKLAAYYLAQGQDARARLISRDMENEPRERLAAIRRALEAVTSKDFWEIIDRGRNFEYMPEAQRAKLAEFFAWLDVGTDRPLEVTTRRLG
jgi:hypothetical protein